MNKKLYIAILAAFLLTSAFVAFLQAGDQNKKMMMKSATIEGVLVDTKCFAMGGFKSNEHMSMAGKKMPNCATACAAMGIPVALVDSDNKVHFLAVPAASYSKWMAMELRLTGMNGKHADIFIPEKLQVKENGKWVDKELPGTMM